ncbi:hypothetical protein IV203_032157 [Nitzschia inconspicua]|uniref:Uncharacterized protein n=1 Tax=Nitzschia inconspicua TaxID=303405 RepID=A0A9K3LWJ6_9STRA|nr:hypothetical protein IV203_032157 [Nitzschia inconspicua]
MTATLCFPTNGSNDASRMWLDVGFLEIVLCSLRRLYGLSGFGIVLGWLLYRTWDGREEVLEFSPVMQHIVYCSEYDASLIQCRNHGFRNHFMVYFLFCVWWKGFFGPVMETNYIIHQFATNNPAFARFEESSSRVCSSTRMYVKQLLKYEVGVGGWAVKAMVIWLQQ